MKKLCIFVVCLTSTAAVAQSTTQWQPSKTPQAIKKAVSDAANWNALKCSGVMTRGGQSTPITFKAEAIRNYIENSNDVFISATLTQPLIKFTAHTGVDTAVDLAVYVTTTADRKTVTKLDVEYKLTETKMANGGTLDQPITQKVTTVTEVDTGSCQ